MIKLPELGYAYDALEPQIDAKTMEIHHTKHHQAYIDKLNDALAKIDKSDLDCDGVKELLKDINSIPEEVRTVIQNNGGGHINHKMFWTLLKKEGGEPQGQVKEAIDKSFGSYEAFKEEFSKAAVGRFGSGWAWLIKKEDGSLEITSTPNQDNPIMEGKKPILGLDVWEHAYYLNYQNKRPDYIKAFFEIINWEEVEKLYNEA